MRFDARRVMQENAECIVPALEAGIHALTESRPIPKSLKW
jgi:hypothetical protein